MLWDSVPKSEAIFGPSCSSQLMFLFKWMLLFQIFFEDIWRYSSFHIIYKHLMSFIFILSNSLYLIPNPNWRRSDSKMSFRLFQQPRGWYLYFVIIYTLSTPCKSEEFINVARLWVSVPKSKPIFGPCSSQLMFFIVINAFIFRFLFEDIWRHSFFRIIYNI